MGLTHTIDEETNLVHILGDYADPGEWQRVLERILADPRRRSGCLILRDQRGGTTPIDVASVVAIMGVVRSFWRRLEVRRAAIVMSREFEMPALVAEALAADHEMPIRAFRSYDDALEWLRGPATHDRW